MNDRISSKPNRIKITHENGSVEYVTWERADEPLQEGTPLNKATLFSSAVEDRYGVSTPSKAFEAMVNTWSIVVLVSGWSFSATDGFYTNQVNVEGVKSIFNPIWYLNDTNAATLEDTISAFTQINVMETYDGYVIFKAMEKPSVDVPIGIRGV